MRCKQRGEGIHAIQQGQGILKHTGTTKTTLSKVVWQIILSPYQKKNKPLRCVQLQAITQLH